MKKSHKVITMGFVVTFSIIALCCSSVPKEIPLDMALEELKQNAYECTAKLDYRGAEKYYNTIIERYGTNTQVFVSAEFEIGHLYIKQKNYKKAEPYLKNVLAYYDADNGSLPAQYKKLAEIDLDKIHATEMAKLRKEQEKQEKAQAKEKIIQSKRPHFS